MASAMVPDDLRDDVYELQEEIFNLKKEHEDLKKEHEKLAEIVLKEKSKNSRRRKDYKQFVSDHHVSLHTMRKKLCLVQKLLRGRKQQPVSPGGSEASTPQNPIAGNTSGKRFSLIRRIVPRQQQCVGIEDNADSVPADNSSAGLPEADEISVSEKNSPVDLDLVDSHLFKRPEDDSFVLLDIAVITEDYTIALSHESNGNNTYIMFLRIKEGRIKKTQRSRNLEAKYQKMTVLKGSDSIALTDGYKIKILPFTYNGDVFQLDYRRECIYKKNKSPITAIAGVSDCSLAVAHASQIVFLTTAGGLSRTVDFQTSKLSVRFFSRTETIDMGVNSMFATEEHRLLICGSHGVHAMDLFTGTYHLVKVPGIKTIHGITSCTENCFYAWDSKKSLYLIERPPKKVTQKSSLAKHIRVGDEVQQFSACGNGKLVCRTKFGFVKLFAINGADDESCA